MSAKDTKKHTPGPWHVREGKYGNLLVEHDTNARGSTWVLAMLDAQQYEERFMAPGTQAANAALIAQAPDLLARAERAEEAFNNEAMAHTETLAQRDELAEALRECIRALNADAQQEQGEGREGLASNAINAARAALAKVPKP